MDERTKVDLGAIADAGTRIYLTATLFLEGDERLREAYRGWLVRALRNFEKVTGINVALNEIKEYQNEEDNMEKDS